MNEFKFKKKYGQNFIKDENLINKIVNSAEISNSYRNWPRNGSTYY